LCNSHDEQQERSPAVLLVDESGSDDPLLVIHKGSGERSRRLVPGVPAVAAEEGVERCKGWAG
jgi:hypothetical protein